MRGFQHLVRELLINEVAPLLELDDYLALRLVSRRVSSVFSCDGVWKTKLQKCYSEMGETLPSCVSNYRDHMLELRSKNRQLEKLLIEVKIAESLVMLLKEKSLLLPGLMRIIKRDKLLHIGLIHDAIHCIKILMCMKKLKLEVYNGRKTFKLTMADMLEIEFASNPTDKCFKRSLGWYIMGLMESLITLRPTSFSQRDKEAEFVEKVISKYLETLRNVRIATNRWNKPKFLWETFITDRELHRSAILEICRICFFIDLYYVSSYDCLQVTELNSQRVSNFKINFSKFKYQMMDELSVDPRAEKIKLVMTSTSFLLIARQSELRHLESIVGEMNVGFQSLEKRFVLNNNQKTYLKPVKPYEKMLLAMMVCNKTFSSWGVPDQICTTLKSWKSKKIPNLELELQFGSTFKLKGTSRILVCVDYGFPHSEYIGSHDRICISGWITYVIREEERKPRYLFYTEGGWFEREGCEFRLKDLEITDDIEMVHRICNPYTFGPLFSRFDHKTRRFIGRDELSFLTADF